MNPQSRNPQSRNTQPSLGAPPRRKRIRIFAKGNFDVQHSLVVCQSAGEVVWNGINQVFAERNLPIVAQVRHELAVRSDVLLNQPREAPAELADLHLPLAPFTLESQFSARLFNEPFEVAVLSVQPDIVNTPYYSRRHRCFLLPYGRQDWTAEQRRWFDGEFRAAADLAAADSMGNLREIVKRLRASGRPEILIFNMSSFVPGERIFSYSGISGCLSERIKCFNLALIELSRELDLAIVDIDRLLTQHGAGALKLTFSHFAPAAWRLIAEEVVYILEQRGLLDCQREPE